MHLSEKQKEKVEAGKNFKSGPKKMGGKLKEALGKVETMQRERKSESKTDRKKERKVHKERRRRRGNLEKERLYVTDICESGGEMKPLNVFYLVVS